MAPIMVNKNIAIWQSGNEGIKQIQATYQKLRLEPFCQKQALSGTRKAEMDW